MILFVGLSASVSADTNSASEADLKAAYIYNFARYAEWKGKKKNASTFVICVHRRSDLFKSLKKLESKKLKGIKIKVIAVGDGEGCLVPCHMVVLPKLSPSKLKAFVRKSTKENVLSVSDIDGYGEYGVMINLKKVSNKMTFEVNLNELSHSKIKLSSNLLRLAKIVKTL